MLILRFTEEERQQLLALFRVGDLAIKTYKEALQNNTADIKNARDNLAALKERVAFAEEESTFNFARLPWR